MRCTIKTFHDDINDFCTASKPPTVKEKANKAEDAFKMTSDGRIIISADQDSDEGTCNKRVRSLSSVA